MMPTLVQLLVWRKIEPGKPVILNGKTMATKSMRSMIIKMKMKKLLMIKWGYKNL